MFQTKWLYPNDGGSGGAGGNQGAGQGQSQGQGGAGGTQGTDKGQDQSAGGKENAPVFDTWIKDQKPEVVKMLDTHTKGLKTALDAEREIREGTERQLRELAKKAEKGSDAEKKLTEMADQIAESDRKADFYDEAHKAGITNLKLAFLVATQDKLFDSKGRVNFEVMKKGYPELFGGKLIADGNAGSGTEGGAGGAMDMNARIRKAAGRSG